MVCIGCYQLVPGQFKRSEITIMTFFQAKSSSASEAEPVDVVAASMSKRKLDETLSFSSGSKKPKSTKIFRQKRLNKFNWLHCDSEEKMFFIYHVRRQAVRISH